MKNPPQIVQSSDYHTISNKNSFYPVTERTFPICSDYYNPLAILMDGLHFMIYQFNSLSDEAIKQNEVIKYNIFGIYKIETNDNENKYVDEIAVIVSKIPYNMYVSGSDLLSHLHNKNTKEVEHLRLLASRIIANSIDFEIIHDNKSYIYKTDIIHEPRLVKILKAIQNNNIINLQSESSTMLTSVVQICYSTLNFVIKDDVLKYIKPKHLQQYIEEVRMYPKKHTSILLPHLQYKEDMLQYMKNKYMLNNEIIEYLKNTNSYYRKDLSKEFEYPNEEFQKRINTKISELIEFVKLNNISLSNTFKETMKDKNENRIYLTFQYPVANILRYMGKETSMYPAYNTCMQWMGISDNTTINMLYSFYFSMPSLKLKTHNLKQRN